MAQTGALSSRQIGFAAAPDCVLALDWGARHEQNLGANNTCMLAAQQRHVLSGTGMEQLPITDGAPVQRRGEFKAGQISSLMAFLLVPCSPIFQSLWPTNRLCSPPSGSCILYLHIAPSQGPPSVCAVCKPQDSPRSVRLRSFLPNELLCSFSTGSASHIP
ncbi:hypothetical protein SVAN01_07566 [Stagonosporopsis vannaccii]|nr:hypothetical protein SVAN01_07566 [Stagonosporopsis vannaccii]